MSVFEDPAYMAAAKAELRAYVATGKLPPSMQSDQPAARPDEPKPWRYWKDWELRAVADLLRSGDRFYTDQARTVLPLRSAKSIQNKVNEVGGRQAFLYKYGDL